ncbi:MAG: hypothetical protein Q9181_002693 [Wetmoreana brouardii]
MSLAIEALRQIHEDQKRPFDGVTLRETDIKAALVMPDTDDGVEIQAAADVKILDESDLLQGESRHILYPATVDACLQLIIISINAGLHKQMPYGVVPVKVGEVSFWFPEGDLGSHGRAVAWTDKFEPRYFNTHTKLMGKSGNLIMDIKNLRCVAYEAAIPPKFAKDRPLESYTESLWKPNISTLTTSKLTGLWDGSSLAQVVNNWVELLDHKHKLGKLLLLRRPDESSLYTLLQAVPMATSIMIGYITADQLRVHEASDEAYDRILTVLLSENTDEWGDSLTNSYDLIVILINAPNIMTHRRTLQTLKTLTYQHSWLLANGQDTSCDGASKQLFSSGWSVTEIPVASNETVLFCDSTLFTNGVNYDNERKI